MLEGERDCSAVNYVHAQRIQTRKGSERADSAEAEDGRARDHMGRGAIEGQSN